MIRTGPDPSGSFFRHVHSQDIEFKDSKFINQFEIERRKTNKLEINKKNIEKITKKTLLFMLFFIAFLDFSSVYISLMISELKIQENISWDF